MNNVNDNKFYRGEVYTEHSIVKHLIAFSEPA